MLHSRLVEFVQWTGKVEGTHGRVACLDDENRLKSIMAVGANKDPIDFRDREVDVIWRDTGVKIVKAVWKINQKQNLMPDYLLRMRDMFREAEGRSEASQGAVCYICQQVDRTQLPLTPASRCCLCLLTSHPACETNLVDRLSSQLSSGQLNSSTAASTLPSSAPVGFVWPTLFQPQSRSTRHRW